MAFLAPEEGYTINPRFYAAGAVVIVVLSSTQRHYATVGMFSVAFSRAITYLPAGQMNYQQNGFSGVPFNEGAGYRLFLRFSVLVSAAVFAPVCAVFLYFLFAIFRSF